MEERSWPARPAESASSRPRYNDPADRRDGVQPTEVRTSGIRNKVRRAEAVAADRAAKKKAKKERKLKRKRLEESGEEAPPKQVPRTLENTRTPDATMVAAAEVGAGAEAGAAAADEEVRAEELMDEFASYYAGRAPPQVMITTGKRATKASFDFVKELLDVVPGMRYYKRGAYELKEICGYATNRGFTDMLVTSEDHKAVTGLWLVHLPGGPTAHFKLTSLKLARDIRGHGNATAHRPELILNQFDTRLGRRMGRMIGALFPLDPQFRGRNCATFHNQRDFIFFRRHRYVFQNEGKKAKLQELGPRFTLKLRSLQLSAFDTTSGEYEWMHKMHEQDTSRRTFHLWCVPATLPAALRCTLPDRAARCVLLAVC